MEIKGKIIAVLPVKTGTSAKGTAWSSQNYVVETEEDHPKRCLFEVFGEEHISKFNISLDDRVTVKFDTTAFKYNDTWCGKNRAWDVVKES